MKKLGTSLLMCGFILSSLGSIQVSAANKEVNTIGDITFIEGGGDGSIDTLDPNPDTSPSKNPDPNPEPVTDGDAGKGALKFSYLPKIHFGISELNAQNVSYYYAEYLERGYGEQGEIGKYPTFLTVQDVRGGAKGWKVTAQHDGKFTNKTDTTDILKARIQFNQANIHTNTFTEVSDIAKYQPTSKVTEQGTQYMTISNDSNQEIELMTAEAGTGYGKWSQGFGATDKMTSGKGRDGVEATGKVNPTKVNRNLGVRLEFPAQVAQTEIAKNIYEATIIWGLSDTL